MAQKGPEQERGEGRTNGDKDQCMAEMAMVFELQQRVIGAADQRVGIGQQAGAQSDQRGRARVLRLAKSLGAGGAGDALSNNIHIEQRKAVHRIATSDFVRRS